MGKSFASVGAALPPRRDLIAAADTPAPSSGFGHSIIVPEARDRLLELFQREQLPQDVRYTLDGSLTGDLHRQQLLFQAMIDTWPRLQKSLREIQLKVRNAPWKVVPWARRGEKPTKEAETLANEVENSIWSMKPVMRKGLKGFEGTVEEIAMGYWLGHYVGEIHWQREDGMWRPQHTKTLPPRFYGYPSWDEGDDRLMLDKSGGKEGVMNLEDFPDHRFLTAVHGGHPGHPTIAAPLRALTGYWLGAVYGLKWLMQFAQHFGIPFRWAEYATGDAAAKAEVVDMMRRIGSEGWAAFPTGTKMHFLDSSKGGSSLVQRELLDLADEQCDIFILGQNLTSASGDKGARALGEVHMEVRDDIVKGVSDFVGEVLTHQLAPSIVALNYGDSRKDVPGVWAVYEEPKDEKGLAERDNALGITSGKVPVTKAWFYERHGIPMPAAGDEIYEPTADPEPPQIGPDGKPLPPKPGEKKPVPEKEEDEDSEKVEAANWNEVPDHLKADPALKDLMKRMEQAMKKGSIVDADAIADLLGAAWINAAKEEPDGE